MLYLEVLGVATQRAKELANFSTLHKNTVRDLESAGKLSASAGQPRIGTTKSEVGDWTPPSLKDLLPGKGTLRGVALTWQRSARAFQGYYAGAMPGSHSSAYGGPRTPADPVISLALPGQVSRRGFMSVSLSWCILHYLKVFSKYIPKPHPRVGCRVGAMRLQAGRMQSPGCRLQAAMAHSGHVQHGSAGCQAAGGKVQVEGWIGMRSARNIASHSFPVPLERGRTSPSPARLWPTPLYTGLACSALQTHSS